MLLLASLLPWGEHNLMPRGDRLINQYHMANASQMHRMFEYLVISVRNTVCNSEAHVYVLMESNCTRTPIADYMQVLRERIPNAD